MEHRLVCRRVRLSPEPQVLADRQRQCLAILSHIARLGVGIHAARLHAAQARIYRMHQPCTAGMPATRSYSWVWVCMPQGHTQHRCACINASTLRRRHACREIAYSTGAHASRASTLHCGHAHREITRLGVGMHATRSHTVQAGPGGSCRRPQLRGSFGACPASLPCFAATLGPLPSMPTPSASAYELLRLAQPRPGAFE